METDVQQMMLVKEEAPEEQTTGVNQQDPEHLHIKEEQEELWTSLEGEHHHLKEETDAARFWFTAVSIKSEDDEEKPLISQLHQQQIEDIDVPTSSSADQMTAETGGGAETSRNPNLNPHEQTSDSSETEVSGDDEDDDVTLDSELSDSGPEAGDVDDVWNDSRSSQLDDLKMNAASFYGKSAGGFRARAPPVESDDSSLSDSGESDEEYIPEPGVENGSSSEWTGDESSSSDEATDETHPTPQSTSAPPARGKPAAPPKGKRQKYTWKTVKQQSSAKKVPVWEEALPERESVRLPIHYFRDFFDSELLNNIVAQSNMYSTQQNPNHALKLDRTELEQFIGTVVYMSVFHLPRSRMFWSSACRIPQVADVMSRDRWKEIKHFIHFCDNMTPDNNDRLFKIRLIIDSLLPKFQALPQQQMLCVDEQMVPFKGKSALKQYIPKKPYKWGYKIFVLCDTRGLVHSFDIYTGNIDPVPGQPDIGASGNIVLKLAHVIHSNVNHLLYFDNWFSSVNLFVALAKKGIPALGTVQQNRLHGCSFSVDSEMKKKGRGTFEEKQAVVDDVDIRAVKWFDNRGVIVGSTFASAQPVSMIQRWDRKLKKNVSVECPSIISLCNKFMGGVDALDALIAYYRIHIRSRKYYHRLFFHFVDMVIVNSWLLYRYDCESLGVLRKKQKDLLEFRMSIAQALCMGGKDMMGRKRGRPSSDIERLFQRKKRRGPAKAIPVQEVRTDAVGHWPEVENGRQRCKLPLCKGQTVYKCAKCNVHLCLNKHNNCFRDFHT